MPPAPVTAYPWSPPTAAAQSVDDPTSVLTNADLGDGPTAIVTRDVTTDILAASSTLAVSGA